MTTTPDTIYDDKGDDFDEREAVLMVGRVRQAQRMIAEHGAVWTARYLEQSNAVVLKQALNRERLP